MFKNIKDAVLFIESRTAKEYKDDKFKDVLNKYQNPQDSLKCIHVAGTNGKGSTATMIADVLVNSGYTCGLFRSPHLNKHNERISINHHDIDDDILLRYINTIYQDIIDYSLIMFEIDFLIALMYFKESEVDIAVVETGIGGLHDSTNVVTPLVSTITSVSYDHQELLGNTIKEIAYQKAGIIKPGVPVTTAVRNVEALSVIEECAAKRNAALTKAPNCSYTKKDGYLYIKYQSEEVVLVSEADYQVENASLAIVTLDVLKQVYGYDISWKVLKRTFFEFRMKGRFEQISKNPTIFLDGAHNVAAIKKLIEITGEHSDEYVIIFSALERKNYQNMLTLLQDVYPEVVFCSFDHAGVLNEDLMIKKHVKTFDNVCKALEYYSLKYADKNVIICGSLYFVAEVRKKLM